MLCGWNAIRPKWCCVVPNGLILSHWMVNIIPLNGWFAGRSGLAVTCLTAVWEDQGSNPTVGSCMFIVNITTIYSLVHGLHTITAVPRSTQPSTLRGMIKWVAAFELSNNNKWRWWVWLLVAYRQTHSPGRLAWSEGRRPLGAVERSSYEPGELLQWFWATMTAP